jgi:cell division protein FtsI (penicillin-binding protein 3)
MIKSDKRIINRMNIVFFLFLLFSFFVIGKIFYLQNTYEQNTSFSIETIKNVEVEPSRGNIYSENGDLIVSTITKYELRWDSKIPSQNLYNFRFR